MAHYKTDGAKCLSLWKHEGRVERSVPSPPVVDPVRPKMPRRRETMAFSPVCEVMGEKVRPEHRVDQERIISETSLEADTDY